MPQTGSRISFWEGWLTRWDWFSLHCCGSLWKVNQGPTKWQRFSENRALCIVTWSPGKISLTRKQKRNIRGTSHFGTLNSIGWAALFTSLRFPTSMISISLKSSETSSMIFFLFSFSLSFQSQVGSHDIAVMSYFTAIISFHWRSQQNFLVSWDCRVLGAWPKASLSPNQKKPMIEGPVCEYSRILGWHSKSRFDETDLESQMDPSSFAFNSSILWDPERWGRPSSSQANSQVTPDQSSSSILYVTHRFSPKIHGMLPI